MLIYHPSTGLQEVHKLPSAIPAGTYLDSLIANANSRIHYWELRIKRKTSGHKWKRISKDQLPKRLKTEALLLGVVL